MSIDSGVTKPPQTIKENFVHYPSTQAVEQFASALMLTAESYRDMAENSENYPLFFRPGTEPSVINTQDNWVLSHIGDIFETTAIFSLTRIGLSMADIALRKVTNEKVSIPDEACFWTSMVTAVLIPSLIELNQNLPIPFIHSNGDPADLLGVGVAAVVLIGTHYRKELIQFAKDHLSKVIK